VKTNCPVRAEREEKIRHTGWETEKELVREDDQSGLQGKEGAGRGKPLEAG